MKEVYLVFVRWSVVDTHYQCVDRFDTLEKAERHAENQMYLGAIATRVEHRVLPAKKEGEHVEQD